VATAQGGFDSHATTCFTPITITADAITEGNEHFTNLSDRKGTGAAIGTRGGSNTISS
jgi:hypothetical protein